MLRQSKAGTHISTLILTLQRPATDAAFERISRPVAASFVVDVRGTARMGAGREEQAQCGVRFFA
jgi:hypothetical protein